MPEPVGACDAAHSVTRSERERSTTIRRDTTVMLDFLRGLRPFDRVVVLPALILFPIFFAAVMHRSIADEFGEGAYRVTLVAMLLAAVWGALLVHKHVRDYPATIALGVLILAVANVILGAVGWHRTYLVAGAAISSVTLTYLIEHALEKRRRDAEAELVVDVSIEAPLPFDATAYQRNLAAWERDLLDGIATRAGGRDSDLPKGPMTA